MTNLQQKVEQLQTTNALMKEDLAISKNQVITLQDENADLRKLCDQLSQKVKKELEVKILRHLPFVLLVLIIMLIHSVN